MESLWPILIIWLLFAIFGRKKRPAPPPGAGAGPARPDAAAEGAGFMAQLQHALEELKRAEHQAQGGALPGAPGTFPPKPPAATAGEVRARDYLAEKKLAAARRGAAQRRIEQVFLPTAGRHAPVRRPVRPLEDDDADKSSEDASVVSLEGAQDYDDQAERIASERHKVAERRGRMEVSAEAMSAAQQARREGRSDVAIGGAAEHATWHAQLTAAPEAAPAAAGHARRRGPLGRWADGTLRSAIVLGEILGPPAGTR